MLHALDLFFGDQQTLDTNEFHGGKVDNAITIEIEFVGDIVKISSLLLSRNLGQFARAYLRKKGTLYYLSMFSMWFTHSFEAREIRIQDIQAPDRPYRKIPATYGSLISQLLPQFRMVSADHNLQDDANPGKKNVLRDLLAELRQGNVGSSEGGTESNIVTQINSKLEELRALTQRMSGGDAWEEVHQLERDISEALRGVTPGMPRVIIDLAPGIPSLEQLFEGCKVKITDSEFTLDIDRHGLGLQRSFALAVLKTWCDRTEGVERERDYAFAVEEPEIFLHPHATRVMFDTLRDIAVRDQVLFTTHSSDFVNQVALGNIIRIGRTGIASHVCQPDFSDLTFGKMTPQKIHRHMSESRSDMLFADKVLIVEGPSEYYAIHGFAETLGIRLDNENISIVYAQSNNNFAVYHTILNRFDIPHIILGDADGDVPSRLRKYTSGAFSLDNTRVFLHELDFENELAARIDKATFYGIVSQVCRETDKKWDMMEDDMIEQARIAGKTLTEYRASVLGKTLSKPVVGRVAGESLTSDQIEQFTTLLDALNAVRAL